MCMIYIYKTRTSKGKRCSWAERRKENWKGAKYGGSLLAQPQSVQHISCFVYELMSMSRWLSFRFSFFTSPTISLVQSSSFNRLVNAFIDHHSFFFWSRPLFEIFFSSLLTLIIIFLSSNSRKLLESAFPYNGSFCPLVFIFFDQKRELELLCHFLLWSELFARFPNRRSYRLTHIIHVLNLSNVDYVDIDGLCWIPLNPA